jgi:membrane protein YdbS with pleckstrin-like domain
VVKEARGGGGDPAVGRASGATDGQANWFRPSPRLRLVRRGQLAVASVPVLVGAVAVAAAISGAVAAVLTALGLLIAAVIVDLFLGRRVRAWAYAERDDDLLVRRGVLIRRLSVIPYGRMQFVDVTAGPVERAFGLATVRMHTAAAASDARVPGLPAGEAARLRDNLTSLGEARAAGL